MQVSFALLREYPYVTGDNYYGKGNRVSPSENLFARYVRTDTESKWREYFLDWEESMAEGWRSNLWLLFVYTAERRGVEDTRNATPLSRTDEQYVISGRIAYLGAFIFNTFANRRLVEEGASSNPSGHSADPSQERTYSL